MAGPLSGIGIQQTSVTQTFQPARNVEAREDQNTQRQQDAINDTDLNQVGRTDEVQQSREATSESSQVSETRARDDQQSSGSGRGGNIDILV